MRVYDSTDVQEKTASIDRTDRFHPCQKLITNILTKGLFTPQTITISF